MKSRANIIDTYRCVFFLGWTFIFLALLFNIWVVEFIFIPDSTLEWPNTAYLYILQTLSGITGVIFLIIYKNRDRIDSYFIQTETKTLALHAFLFLLAINILLQISFILTVDLSGNRELRLLRWLFHLDIEKNVPSTYSALQLILAGVVALYCMKMEGKRKSQLKLLKYVWLCVAIVLFSMGVDEYFSFHERAGQYITEINLMHSYYSSNLRDYVYAWTVVGGLLSLIIGVTFFFFFIKIFYNYRYLLYILMSSGVGFLLGAIGMENLQFYAKNHEVFINNKYILMVEEFLEMVSVSSVIFVFILFIGEIQLSKEIRTYRERKR